MNQTPLHELWEPGFLPTTSLVSTADVCVLPLPGLAGTRLPAIQFVRVVMQTFHVAGAKSQRVRLCSAASGGDSYFLSTAVSCLAMAMAVCF